MVKKFQLRYFIDVVNESNLLGGEFSGLELIWQLKKYSEKSKLEIQEYLLFNKNDRDQYLRLVISMLKGLDIDKKQYQETVDKILKTNNSSIEEVLTDRIENIQFYNYLCASYTSFKGDERDRAFFYQRNLVNHFQSFYVQDLIDFCRQMLPNTEVTFANYNKEIFKSELADKWYKDCVAESAYLDVNNKALRGFRAFASAIFYEDECKRLIFKNGLKLETYIAFLNKEYHTNIKSYKSLSDGINHKISVKESIQEFENRLPAQ